MLLKERLKLIDNMCSELYRNSSRTQKELIVKKYRDMDEQLSYDITYLFEILAGVHKLGYSFVQAKKTSSITDTRHETEMSLQKYLEPLYSNEDRTMSGIYIVCAPYFQFYDILNPILNRLWRLGIGKSQLDKLIIDPMLAKKYEPTKHCKDPNDLYFITEKLDGNRCISYWDHGLRKWVFYSRSGKELKVNFDMQYMPNNYVFDGEILSRQQIENPSQHNFNGLSGAINSKYGDKSDLVYMIFDIVDDTVCYEDRRYTLNEISNAREPVQSNVKILPLLACLQSKDMPKLPELLEIIENKGGEGLMINVGSAVYVHKRTDKLLKVKSTYTMDMRVVDFEYGEGKYEGAIGALVCEAYVYGMVYQCKVGSGLSDDQRFAWADNPDLILNEIIEVAYFSLSQDKNSQGTSVFSLRFPRFKRIRTDKTTTSVD